MSFDKFVEMQYYVWGICKSQKKRLVGLAVVLALYYTFTLIGQLAFVSLNLPEPRTILKPRFSRPSVEDDIEDADLADKLPDLAADYFIKNWNEQQKQHGFWEYEEEDDNDDDDEDYNDDEDGEIEAQMVDKRKDQLVEPQVDPKEGQVQKGVSNSIHGPKENLENLHIVEKEKELADTFMKLYPKKIADLKLPEKRVNPKPPNIQLGDQKRYDRKPYFGKRYADSPRVGFGDQTDDFRQVRNNVMPKHDQFMDYDQRSQFKPGRDIRMDPGRMHDYNAYDNRKIDVRPAYDNSYAGEHFRRARYDDQRMNPRPGFEQYPDNNNRRLFGRNNEDNFLMDQGFRNYQNDRMNAKDIRGEYAEPPIRRGANAFQYKGVRGEEGIIQPPFRKVPPEYLAREPKAQPVNNQVKQDPRARNREAYEKIIQDKQPDNVLNKGVLAYNPQLQSAVWQTLDTILQGNSKLQHDGDDDELSQILKQVLPEQLKVSVGMEIQVQTIDQNKPSLFLEEPILVDLKPNALLIFVESDPGNYKRRQMIRSTWAKKDYLDISNAQVIFATGVENNDEKTKTLHGALSMEANLYHDILLLNMADIYDSLTYKGLLTMTWIASKHNYFDYIMKTDDDVTLNLIAWKSILDNHVKNKLTCALIGFMYTPHIQPVYRDGKAKVSKAEYFKDFYPGFTTGVGYILTRPAMVAILRVAYRLPLLSREDVFFTGIAASQTSITRVSAPFNNLLMDAHAGGKGMRFLASHYSVPWSASVDEAWLDGVNKQTKVMEMQNQDLPDRFVVLEALHFDDPCIEKW